MPRLFCLAVDALFLPDALLLLSNGTCWVNELLLLGYVGGTLVVSVDTDHDERAVESWSSSAIMVFID